MIGVMLKTALLRPDNSKKSSGFQKCHERCLYQHGAKWFRSWFGQSCKGSTTDVTDDINDLNMSNNLNQSSIVVAKQDRLQSRKNSLHKLTMSERITM